MNISGKREYSLIIFTLPNCIICNGIKGILRDNNIIFEEVNAEDPYLEDVINTLEKNLKTNSYPIINISKYNSTKTILLKSNLSPSKNIIILDDIEEIIKFIKNEI